MCIQTVVAEFLLLVIYI